MTEWINVDDKLPKHKPTFCIVYLEDSCPSTWSAVYDFQYDDEGEEIPETGVFHLAEGIEKASEVVLWFELPNLLEEYNG